MIGKYDAANQEVTITDPLIVEIVIKDTNGEPLISLGERLLAPGNTVRWDYPADGLKIGMSSA